MQISKVNVNSNLNKRNAQPIQMIVVPKVHTSQASFKRAPAISQKLYKNVLRAMQNFFQPVMKKVNHEKVIKNHLATNLKVDRRRFKNLGSNHSTMQNFKIQRQNVGSRNK